MDFLLQGQPLVAIQVQDQEQYLPLDILVQMLLQDIQRRWHLKNLQPQDILIDRPERLGIRIKPQALHKGHRQVTRHKELLQP